MKALTRGLDPASAGRVRPSLASEEKRCQERQEPFSGRARQENGVRSQIPLGAAPGAQGRAHARARSRASTSFAAPSNEPGRPVHVDDPGDIGGPGQRLVSGAAGEAVAPRIASELNTDQRQARNYPEQPPLIPHKIEGYQLDLNSNKCLSCHSRRRTEDSQAPMVSVTHFMDRDGNFLADVSPRRYFCQQCHVPQTDTTPPVGNDFLDVDDLLKAETKK